MCFFLKDGFICLLEFHIFNSFLPHSYHRNEIVNPMLLFFAVKPRKLTKEKLGLSQWCRIVSLDEADNLFKSGFTVES